MLGTAMLRDSNLKMQCRLSDGENLLRMSWIIVRSASDWCAMCCRFIRQQPGMCRAVVIMRNCMMPSNGSHANGVGWVVAASM